MENKEKFIKSSYRHLFYSVLDSTHLLARRLAMEGMIEGIVIVSEEQSNGVGKHGKKWESPRGNFYLSILTSSRYSSDDSNFLSLLVACAVHEYISSVYHDKSAVKLKWPNDIYILDKKVSGILLEIPIIGKLIVSIGINTCIKPENLENLADKIDIPNNEGVVDKIIDNINKWHEEFQLNKQYIVDYWMENMLGVGNLVVVKQGERELSGVLKGLDNTGRMLMEDPLKGEIKVSTGDVFFREFY